MKYYYKTVVVKSLGTFNFNFPLDEMEEELNRLGQMGWELVSTTLQANPYQLLLILKNNTVNLNSE